MINGAWLSFGMSVECELSLGDRSDDPGEMHCCQGLSTKIYYDSKQICEDIRGGPWFALWNCYTPLLLLAIVGHVGLSKSNTVPYLYSVVI